MPGPTSILPWIAKTDEKAGTESDCKSMDQTNDWRLNHDGLQLRNSVEGESETRLLFAYSSSKHALSTCFDSLRPRQTFPRR